MYLHLIKLTAGSSWSLLSGGGQSGGYHAAAQSVVQRQCCRRGRAAVFRRGPLCDRSPRLHRPSLRRLRVAPRRHCAAGGGGGVAGGDGSRRAHRLLLHRRRAHRRLPPPPAPRRRRRRRRRGAPRAGRRADAAGGAGRAAARRRAIGLAVARSGGRSRRQQRVAAAGAPAVAQPVGGAAAADAAPAVPAGAGPLISRQLAFARFRRHGGRRPHAVPVLRRNARPRFSFDIIRFGSRNRRGGGDGVVVWRVAPPPAGAAPPRPLQWLRLRHHAPALLRGARHVARVTHKEASPVCKRIATPTDIAPAPRRPRRPPRSLSRRRPRRLRCARGSRSARLRGSAGPPLLLCVFQPRARRAARRASLDRGRRRRVLCARVRPFVGIRCFSALRRPL